MAKKTSIILPKNLEAGAVIPQCLDNQFVSDEIFQYMIKNNLCFSDNKIQQLRRVSIQTELNRAWVYSPQIIINRAFFWNNRVFYSTFLDNKNNKKNRKAVINLINDETIIAYLHDKFKVEEEPDFDLDENGVRAFKSLIKDVDYFKCVRFSEDEKENKKEIEAMGERFRIYFRDFFQREDILIYQTAEGLVPGRESPERTKRIINLVDEFKSWEMPLQAFLNENSGANRDHYYKEFICEKESKVALGKFKNPSLSPNVLEKKKLLDLRYNTNLADSLKSYAFTPSEMPKRTCLGIDSDTGFKSGEQFLESIANNIRHTFVEGVQGSFNLPLLKDLEMQDIYEIRHLDGWGEYIEKQREILKNPFNCLDHLEEFSGALCTFNTQVTDWYFNQKRLPIIEKRYRMIVRVAIKVAGVFIAHDLTENIYAMALALLLKIPDTALDYSVSLLVDFFPEFGGEVDRQLGYSLDIISYDINVTKESLTQLVRKAKEATKARSPSIITDSANQSKY